MFKFFLEIFNKRFSLKFRISLFFSLSAFLVLIMFSVSLFFLYKIYYIDRIDKDLRGYADYVKSIIDERDMRNNYKQYGFPINHLEIENLKKLGINIFIKNLFDSTVTDPLPHDLRMGFSYNTFEKRPYRFFYGVQNAYGYIIGKDLTEFYDVRLKLQILLINLNIVFGLLAFLFAYTTGDFAMKPLKKFLNAIKGLDVRKMKKDEFNWKVYGDDDLGNLAKQFSKFIDQTQEVFKEQKEFLEDASHELRTPLMVMSTSLEFLEQVYLPVKKKEKLTMISQSVDKMKLIVENLLFLTRGESSDNAKNQVNIYDYLLDLIKNYDLLLQTKKLKLSIEEKNPLILETNSYHLDRLFSNLIKNAIEYNIENGIINIKIDKKYVIIEDTGIGIAKDELEKIWNRFYRSKKGISTSSKGVGLGLSIVKKIADINGRKISVISKEGKGTKFIITFI